MVCLVGLGDRLAGVTHECDYPPGVLSLPKVTRTLIPHDAMSARIDEMVREKLKTQRALYTLDMEVLERLHPDLIVTQALCDVCAVAEAEVQTAACSLPGAPRVLNLEPTTLAEVFAAIVQVGEAAGVADAARQAVAGLRERVALVAKRTAGGVSAPPRVILLEWVDPPFCCGHWSPELVELAGGKEGIGRHGTPSRTMAWDEVLAWQPEVMVLACCGFSIQRTLQDLPILRDRPGWRSLPCVRSGRVYAVDGSAYFSRPGPRLVDSLEILANALHPELHRLPAGRTAALRVEG
jgi:iron complex transport system substrate-binding protein